jgi:hypothetical protein
MDSGIEMNKGGLKRPGAESETILASHAAHSLLSVAKVRCGRRQTSRLEPGVGVGMFNLGNGIEAGIWRCIVRNS